MAKRYRINIRKFKIEPEELNLSALPEDMKITKEDNAVLFEFKEEMTEEDKKELNKLYPLLNLTEKEEYAVLTTDTEKLNFIAKRLGLK